MPRIDVQKCNGCGLCVGVCQCQIIVVVQNKASIIPKEKCRDCHTWCSQCELVCPNDAISCPFEVIIDRDAIESS